MQNYESPGQISSESEKERKENLKRRDGSSEAQY